MSEKIYVQLDDIRNLFVDMIVDCETGDFNLTSFSMENSHQVDVLIKEYILKRYKQLENNQKVWLKLSLSYFLTYEPNIFSKLNDDGYIPVEVTARFLEKVWDVLFFNESYQFEGKPDCVLY